jgi:hypothetical protein
MLLIRSKKETTERFPIRSRDHQLLEVSDAKLRRPRDIATNAWWYVPRVYDLILLEIKEAAKDSRYPRRRQKGDSKIGEN